MGRGRREPIRRKLNVLRPHFRALFFGALLVSVHIFARCAPRGIFRSKIFDLAIFKRCYDFLFCCQHLRVLSRLVSSFILSSCFIAERKQVHYELTLIFRLEVVVEHTSFRFPAETRDKYCRTCLQYTHLDIRTTNKLYFWKKKSVKKARNSFLWCYPISIFFAIIIISLKKQF